MQTSPSIPEALPDQFRRHWLNSTADENLTLHGFRRFKTTHLLNLRFLEEDIATIDHKIYQAGLGLGFDPTTNDRLGLKHSLRDREPPGIEDTITRELILKLRTLIREYDEALASFGHIMSMETFSLLDDEKQSSQREDLSLYEKLHTRLVRPDLGPRQRQDLLQRKIQKLLRSFRYWTLLRKSENNHVEGPGSSFPAKNRKWSYQNNVLLAEVFSRVMVAATTVIFLVVPLAILSNDLTRSAQLGTISAFMICFASLVTGLLKASSMEIMVVSAAYAAVLSVFVSNATPGHG